MGISFRFYAFPDDGSLRRIPKRIANDLGVSDEAVPEFAGSRQRIAQVILEIDDGRPARIMDARGFFWTFDAQGRLEDDVHASFHLRMDAEEAARRGRAGRVVSLLPEIKRKEQIARDNWTLSAEDLDRIAADLWPGVHGPADEVTSVKGKNPKRPPLTYEAKHALQRLVDSVFQINGILDGLSERALKGLAFEASRSSTFQDEALWRGISEEAKRREQIRGAHRTGRGEWYAVLEIARANRTYPHLWEHITAEHEKCSSRKDAVEACRRLMAGKAAWMDADIELSTNVRSALEWRPDEWD